VSAPPDRARGGGRRTVPDRSSGVEGSAGEAAERVDLLLRRGLLPLAERVGLLVLPLQVRRANSG